MPKLLFPDTFRWGATSSSLAIEGSAEELGRSPSIWDKFSTQAGVIKDGSNPFRSTEHIVHWEHDLNLMKRIALQTYKFSVSWSRVLPNGTASLNDAGLDFYDRLIDGLLARNIEPWLTLNHWDLPLILEDKGGWLKRDTVYHFADYAQKIAARLGDRVAHWITHNDPYAMAFHGYRDGVHAPGETKARGGWIAAHHLLLAHAEAAEALHAEARIPDIRVGIALHLVPTSPASDSDPDHRATIQKDGKQNRWFLDPLFKGEYPDDIFFEAKRDSGEQGLDWIQRGDLSRIHNSSDFLGINYSSRALVRSEETYNAKRSEFPNKKGKTQAGLEFAPEGLRLLLTRVNTDYAPTEIYITENGAAYQDAFDEHGRIPDDLRMAYISGHLQAVNEALVEGVPIKGYFVKSFLDAWEWTDGYSLTYGLVHVDFVHEERTLKNSAYWYARVIDTKDHDWNPGIDYREG
ncbi:MAG: beta-glucosidase [Chitinophagaceae bacterium]|nr:beta-glucosidase [Oligoflexus sp.]